MVCEDVITRLKEELVLEAVDILHEEVKSGRIDMKGYVPLLPDKSNELQHDMYMINNLRMREHEIIEQYRPYLQGHTETDPDKLRQVEELKKFVLSVGAISTLMRFSDTAGAWAEDTGKHSKISDQEKIFVDTIKSSEERLEVLEYVLSSVKFLKSEALSKDEISLLKKALSKAKA